MSTVQGLATELQRRLHALLATLPIRDDDAGSGGGITPPQIEPLPQWLTVPAHLHAAWAGKRPGASRAELYDALWAQYALFLCIRLQDDLLDRQQQDLRLLFVADRFLVESLACVKHPEVWSFYNARLKETIDGILNVRRLEARPGLFTSQHLGLHAQVSGIFKIAAASVCVSCGHPEDMSWISMLMDHLAVFSQICDDVFDVAQDVDADRFTWVANVLLQAGAGFEENIGIDERQRRLSEGLLREERRAAVVDELREVAQGAVNAVPPSAPLPIHDLAGELRAKADELDRRWHESGVRRVFAGVL